MRTKTRKPARNLRLFFRLIAVLSALGIAVWVLDARLRPGICAISEGVVRQDLTRMMSDAMAKTMQDSPDTYSVLLRDESGKPIAAEVLTQQVNRFQVQLLERMNADLCAYTAHSITISLGDASQNALLAGHGPKVRVQLHPVGDIGIEVQSDFTDAGINQTCHRILVKMTATVRMAAPVHSDEVTVCTEHLLCETILVGDLPDGIWSTP